MGIIYELTKELHDVDYDYSNPNEGDFISFLCFIELLGLYTDDRDDIIANYLVNSDDFLKLNFYQFEDVTDYIKPKIYLYDYYKDDDEPLFPTEDFLSDLSETCSIPRDYDDMYWKIEDILELDCIKKIKLDADTFYKYQNAIEDNHPIRIIEMQEEIDRLKLALHANPTDYSKIQTEYNQIKAELEQTKNKLLSIKQQNNSQELHPRTANNAGKIISALASELLKMDITKPNSKDSNGKIQQAIERQGNTLSKDVIAHWLKIAHEQSK